MAKTLLLGLGGTGSRVVNNVARMLRENGKAINQGGEFCCAVLDTNENDNNDIISSGTGVPVFSTSKAQKIEDYFADYQYLHMEDWCPGSPSFFEQSMIDGASESRVKSRIAFMDCLATGALDRLELMINEVLRAQVDSKIRIMIVSSLSGGTGSGMFIQTALWLREHLRQQQITIRGIFLLPDVFIDTIEDIKNNATSKARHYANAYAAIRELNAISKIRNNGTFTPSEPVRLDSLFDSETDKDQGRPVFDFVFFVDNKDQNGVRLGSIGDYERFVAQLVYMQMYAPMKDDMYSEEDNTFLAFSKSDEPLYGACGTAKAEYPYASVVTYCTLRAAQDSLTKGWRYIDTEIKAEQDERKQREKDGIFSSDDIDVRARYIKIFDDQAKKSADEVGADRFFLKIGKDIKNETAITDENGKVSLQYTDKVADFLHLLKTKKIETAVTDHSEMKDYELTAEEYVPINHTEEQLKSQVDSDEDGMEESLQTFEGKADDYADTIVSSVFPLSMGEVNGENTISIYGLLSKADRNTGKVCFIHPVAARYVLYKLVQEMEREINEIDLANSKEEALAGGTLDALFDNKATRKTETGPIEMLDSRKKTQKKDKFLDDFENRYVQFINTKIGLCESYEKKLLQTKVYRLILNRVKDLIRLMEAFFNRLEDVSDKLDEGLEVNKRETVVDSGKTIYILGTADHKERLYERLDMETETADVEINKGVIDAVYGRLCAEKRPGTEANKPYANVNAVTAFLQKVVLSFRSRIENKRENLDLVDLDLYTALCLESDFNAEGFRKNKEDDHVGALDALDVKTGAITEDNSVTERHNAAFQKLKNTLRYMAAPFLIYEKEPTTDEMGAVTTRTKTFWGFHPSLTAAYPQAGTVLGINTDLQADSAYRRNELYCYRAVYGLAAQYIPKFNENRGGMYYKCYSALIDDILKNASGIQGKRAFVQTPHLDYNWYRILPSVTPDKDKTDELAFYHGFWLAIAYNRLRTDKNGNAVLRRTIDTGFGSSANDDVPVRYNGKAVACKDSFRLVEALRLDKTFLTADIPELKARFAEELDTMDTYVGTEVMKGLMGASTALHPVDLICRYHEGRDTDKYVEALLIGALEKIALELAQKYNKDRSDEKLEEAKYRICRKIYDSSHRVSGKEDVFSYWTEMFGRLNIKGEPEKK